MFYMRHQQMTSIDDLYENETNVIKPTIEHPITIGKKFEDDIYQLLLKTQLNNHLESNEEFKKSVLHLSYANKRDESKKRIEKCNVVRELEINRRFGVEARGIDHVIILPQETSMIYVQTKWVATELTLRYFNEFMDSVKKLYMHLLSNVEMNKYVSEKCYAIYLSRKSFTTRAKEEIKNWNLENNSRIQFISIANENQTELMDDFKIMCHLYGLFYYDDDGYSEMIDVASINSNIYSPPIAM